MSDLTATEMAEIRDHLKWSNVKPAPAYVELYVNPTLEALSDPAHLAVVRGHLETLNGLYAQLKVLSEGFDIDELKGIKFSKDAEARTWGMYCFWRDQLAQSLSLKVNTASASGGSNRNRGIRR